MATTVSNATIMARAWLDGTSDYQLRIPDVTQAGVHKTAEALLDPLNGEYLNQFGNYLINRLAYTNVHGKVFNNPLGEFMGEKVVYGSSIQNVAFEWLKAHSYRDDSETLLKMARPKGVNWFISQNRRDRYDVSITIPELRTAVANEGGLNQLETKIIDLPSNAAQYDRYHVMRNLFSLFESTWGMPKTKVDKPVDNATALAFLTKVQADAEMFKFPSAMHNAISFANIPSYANKDELILITTPDVYAAIKVLAYAGMYNRDEAWLAKPVIVDYLPIPNAVAILTTREVFDCHEMIFQMEQFRNPENLSIKYFLHDWGIYALNPYTPIKLYLTTDTPADNVVTETPTSFKITVPSETISLGEEMQITTKLDGTVTASIPTIGVGEIAMLPSAATFGISLIKSDADSSSALNRYTYIDGYSVLHVQPDGLAKGDKIVITGRSTYINPTGATPTNLTSSVTITIA